MKPVGVKEGASLEAFIQGAMLDLCTIDVYTEAEGELNEPIVTYVPGEPTVCRFRGKRAEWSPTPDYGISSIDALLQLPKDTVITNRDQVTIIARFGVTLAEPLTYDVKGEPTPAILSLHVQLMEHHL